MKNNYFAKLVKYVKNVYNIEKGLNKLEDRRLNPTYGTAQVITPVLLGFLLRVRSFNSLSLIMKENEFANVLPRGTNLPGIDTVRDTLKVIKTDGLREILRHNFKKAINNKVFAGGTIDGYIVGAIDGTKFFGSNKKNCGKCLTTTTTKSGKTHSYHSGAVMSTIGDGPKLVIDFEMYKPGVDAVSKDEGELSVAKRLLERALTNHANLLDIVVYDALACNAGWFNSCIQHGVEAVVRVKKNNNNSITRVKSTANKMEPREVWIDEKGFEEVKVYDCLFTMENVDRPLRFVKFAMKFPDGTRSQIMIATTCLDMDLRTLFRIIRARWDIENSIFNNMKKECYLDYCFVHGGNAVEAVICLIFIAGNLLQLFYHRRIRKHVATQYELVRLLLKGLYLLKRKPEMVFGTG